MEIVQRVVDIAFAGGAPALPAASPLVGSPGATRRLVRQERYSGAQNLSEQLAQRSALDRRVALSQRQIDKKTLADRTYHNDGSGPRRVVLALPNSAGIAV